MNHTDSVPDFLGWTIIRLMGNLFASILEWKLRRRSRGGGNGGPGCIGCGKIVLFAVAVYLIIELFAFMFPRH